MHSMLLSRHGPQRRRRWRAAAVSVVLMTPNLTWWWPCGTEAWASCVSLVNAMVGGEARWLRRPQDRGAVGDMASRVVRPGGSSVQLRADRVPASGARDAWRVRRGWRPGDPQVQQGRCSSSDRPQAHGRRRPAVAEALAARRGSRGRVLDKVNAVQGAGTGLAALARAARLGLDAGCPSRRRRPRRGGLAQRLAACCPSAPSPPSEVSDSSRPVISPSCVRRAGAAAPTRRSRTRSRSSRRLGGARRARP